MFSIQLNLIQSICEAETPRNDSEKNIVMAVLLGAQKQT